MSFILTRVPTPDSEAVEAVDWVALLQEGEASLPRLGSESDLSDWSEEEEDDKSEYEKNKVTARIYFET